MAGLLVFVMAAWVSLFSTSAWSRSVLDLDAQKQPVALKDWGDYWVDTTAKLTAPGVAATANINWQPTEPQTIYPITVGQALWVRFTVPPADRKSVV